MRSVVLIENREREGFVCEHGLSIYIEHGRKKYLLDAGSSPLFLENAKKLGISLSEVDMAILSHGHYDHSGGYPKFLERNEKAKVYLREEVKDRYFHILPQRIKRYIGVPGELLNQYPERLVFVKENKQISENVWLIGHVGENLEEVGKRCCMYRETEDGLQYDNFHHEQSLVFDTAEGLVLFNSCSHIGIVDIVREVRQFFKGRQVAVVVGGLHLKRSSLDTMRVSEQEVRTMAYLLREEGVKKLYTGHCTGNLAFAILKEELGDCVEYLRVGLEIFQKD